MPKSPLPRPIPRHRQQLIERIVKAGKRGSGQALQAFFRGVGEEDLALHAPHTLARMAECHLAFAAMRRKGKSLVQVITPDSADGGDERCWLLVATDDRPFLIDSISMALAREQVAVHLLVHPVMRVRRDGRGRRLAAELAATTESGNAESWQLYVIDKLHDPQRIERLERAVGHSIAQVALAVDDWQAMRQRARQAIESLRERCPRTVTRSDRDESIALLEWVESAHFVFLGYTYGELQRGRSHDRLVCRSDANLGILRADLSARSRRKQSETSDLRGALRATMRAATPLLITKSERISSVHRAEHLDQISIKDFDARGEVKGEHRFLGLWTATAYFASPGEIPVVRRKVAAVIERFGLDPRSHDGKAVLAVMETWPRDELFQSSIDELTTFARATVNLYERRTTRVMLRRDAPGRFWSCMVFVPRDRYTTETRHRIEQILLDHCGGLEIESQVQISTSSHARVHAMIRGDENLPEQIDVGALERRIAEAVASWADRLRTARVPSLDGSTVARLIERHGARFPSAYQSEVSAADALEDIVELERLAGEAQEARLRLRRPGGTPHHRMHLRIVQGAAAATIAELSPLLENFGLRMLFEQSWQIAAEADLAAATVQDFALESASGEPIDIERSGARFLEALRRVRAGTLDNDGLNRLLLRSHLDADQINVLRACCRYLLQTGLPFSQSYMESTLARHATIAADLFELFRERLDLRGARLHGPSLDGKTPRRERAIVAVERRLEQRLAAIESADEDRILRAFLALVHAVLRCNFLCTDSNGGAPQTLALKLDPTRIPGLPQPRPRAEIYVFGRRVEGVHLRMGEVARGGIRWSDRREDFRTEVLGLMKAQNVKNTLIVPVGAKGGFVVRRPPQGASREALQAAGVAAYRDYINALLDVTDNIVGKRIVTPQGICRRDGEDPYLVVAADKGTATFSDIANAIAVERGFWLGDAFASGGSAGYDHKKMGITARGAWECVKRHFRELGHDTQSQPFTVAGIGDMSGDVFGNGMLLSRHIRLVAAFNHQHIFLDPAPDAARSFAERARLFALPRSSWSDYDRKLISRGGGIFERSAKSVNLSAEIRALLDLEAASVTPQDLIKAILRMRVDLLWNGGIGTYVKSSSETNDAAGDRSNDSVRIDGRELRAKVVGEGGNLGFTQRGRIEYALQGGRINTDFIDNSAGVNTSDVEVNLKILTTRLESRGSLTRKSRDRLLKSLTDEVAELVLRNNYLQSQAISTLQSQSAERLPELQSLIRSLERGGELDRALEFLPDDETLALRRKQGLSLTRPELAVVLAYSKISLNRQLLATDLPEDPYFAQELERYFPPVVRKRYANDIRRHKLHREIITTAVTNSLINRMGPTFVARAQSETGASAADVARAYSIAREIFDARTLWANLEALDNRIDALTQYQAYAASARLLRHATMWLLRDRSGPLEVSKLVQQLAAPIGTLRGILPTTLQGSYLQQYQQSLERLSNAGLPPRIAESLALLQIQGVTLDIAAVAKLGNTSLRETARLWFVAAERLHLDWLEQRIEQLTAEGALQALARTGLRENARVLQSRIVARIMAADGNWDRWARQEASALRQWERTIGEVIAEQSGDFASLSVCVEALRALAE